MTQFLMYISKNKKAPQSPNFESEAGQKEKHRNGRLGPKQR